MQSTKKTSPVNYILSIDIGIHNLGWCVMNTTSEDEQNTFIDFDLYDIDKENNNKDIVLYRTAKVHEFVKQIFDKYSVSTVIVERQVNVNTMAMELMYSLVSAIYVYTNNIIIFDPKLKFTTLSLKYDTKSKQHKKLSIYIVYNYLRHKYPDLVNKFMSYSKRDDISDAILMLLVYVYKNDKHKLITIRNYSLT